MTMTSYNVLIFIKEIWTMSCICKYFQTIVNVFFFFVFFLLFFFLSFYITNIVLSFHVRMCVNVFVACSTFSWHMCFLVLWFGFFLMHLLHKILRFLSSLCNLRMKPNQGLSSWYVSLLMVYFVVALRWKWDRRPLHS